MSARYHDAGSGPHDTEPRTDGLRNCGCEHDGRRWLSMCEAARREYTALHESAKQDRSKQT
jgi:hypothetical protein